MLSYLRNGYKILILIIIILGILGILACVGLLIENLKGRKSKTTTIVSSVITGVSTIAIIIPLVVGIVINNNKKAEYLANTKSFTIASHIDINNVFDGFDQAKILEQKKAEKAIVRNYEFVFNFDSENKTYKLAKDNVSSVIGFVNHNIDYFYYANAQADKTEFVVANENFAIYRPYVKQEITERDITLDVFRENLKRFDFSSYVNDFASKNRTKLVFKAEIVHSPENLIGQVLYKDGTKKTYNELTQPEDSKLNAIHFTFTLEQGTASKYPEKTSGFIIL